MIRYNLSCKARHCDEILMELESYIDKINHSKVRKYADMVPSIPHCQLLQLYIVKVPRKQ